MGGLRVVGLLVVMPFEDLWCESGAMSTAMPFDEEMTRRLVEVYTTRDVVAQRDATLEFLDPQVGERVLDIGSGPGFLAAGIATRMGESGVIATFVPGRRGVTDEEAAAWLEDLHDLGAREEYFFSVNR